MSQLENRVLRIFFAFVVGVFLIYLAINERVEILGIAVSVTKSGTKLVILAGGASLLVVFVILLVLVFFEPEINKPSLAPGAPSNPDVKKALAKLGDLDRSDRVNAIQTIKESLPKDLSGPDVVSILGPLKGSNRQNAIELLGPKTSKDLSDRDITAILNGLRDSERQNAIEVLERRSGSFW